MPTLIKRRKLLLAKRKLRGKSTTTIKTKNIFQYNIYQATAKDCSIRNFSSHKNIYTNFLLSMHQFSEQNKKNSNNFKYLISNFYNAFENI